jgi:hypothetical protein
MFKSDKWDEISQNQFGIEPTMLALEMSNSRTLLCDFNQGGNDGPKAHEPISSKYTWNGGIQLELTFKMNELEDMSKTVNLLSFEKWSLVTTPVN